jgi:type I restriction enzyme M protein
VLDTGTKRRIDTARDILVGKVPDPKSQVEQITIALIYKFMDDMDAEAEELGGKRKFFAGDYSRYGWAKLMRSGLGGHETLNLYAEAIAKMPENPGIPALFRDIFKNAYLPYRDPETLRAFLKIIDEFTYDHSERLGDAFEYLLSVLGSQGDAGQFRTPRHIIDFIVAIVDPKKTETVLDPACGTAGFLISSYKHILKANVDDKGHSTLTPDDKGRLAQNFKGYDISPDMVRLSLVNLYLHGFTDPHIAEYDTLTSQDKWNEHADVILANPPFMSPKGGIKPHNRFSVQSKRSEVLFVDYMAEHLTPGGRAGIIVPEGIVFQSQTAYTQLRKMLVEDYLVAIVSLPAGVFNPYSGVKTSILVLDKLLAKQAHTIAFFKIENDGFGLGAQRREIQKNDLPQARAEIAEYLRRLRARESVEDFQPTLGLVVPKEKIAANGDYNLSGERYREGVASTSTFPMVTLGEVCELVRGVVFSKEDEVADGGVQVLRANNINKDRYELDLADVKRVAPKADFSDDKKLRTDDIFICLASGSKDHIGKVAQVSADTAFYFGGFMGAIRVKTGRLHPNYLFKQLTTGHFNAFLREQIAGANINNLSGGLLYRFQIPLPPLEVQKEIVAEIEGYQKVMDGARAVLDNYRPHIPIHPDWPMVELREVIDELESGVSVNSTSTPTNKGELGILKTSCVTTGVFQPEEHKTVVPDELTRVRCPVRGNTIIISRMNTEALVGANAYVDKDYPHLFLPDRLWQTVITRSDVEVRYIQTVLASDSCRSRISAVCGGTSGSMKNIAKPQLLSITVPLPPLATQQAIVAEIEAEQALVAANRELIARFEKKIQATLARVWGEDEPAPAEA